MLRHLMLLALIVAIAATAFAACSSSDNTPAVVTTPGIKSLPKIRLGYQAGFMLVEVAIKPDELERGLSGRDSLLAQSGMLFDLGSTRVPGFWMKGMRFPLDMVWIDEAGLIVGITPDVPVPPPNTPDEQLQRYSPGAPVRYVLELNAGTAARFGMANGQQVGFTIPRSLYGTPAPGTVTPTPEGGLPPTRTGTVGAAP